MSNKEEETIVAYGTYSCTEVVHEACIIDVTRHDLTELNIIVFYTSREEVL